MGMAKAPETKRPGGGSRAIGKGRPPQPRSGAGLAHAKDHHPAGSSLRYLAARSALRSEGPAAPCACAGKMAYGSAGPHGLPRVAGYGQPNRGPLCGLAGETQRASRDWPGLRPPQAVGEESKSSREGALDHLPHAKSATIVCDGSGGYRTDLGDWAGAPCGTEGCVTAHEQSHARDWLARWPKGCKNADDTNKPDGSKIPLGGDGYPAFLKKSECDAHTVDVACAELLLKGADATCKPKVQTYITDTKAEQAKFC